MTELEESVEDIRGTMVAIPPTPPVSVKDCLFGKCGT